MFKLALSFVFAAALMASPVFAGGSGGAKKDATVKVVNDVPAKPVLVVIADPASALKTKILASTATTNEIIRAGGIIVQPGATGTLPVKAGNAAVFGSVVDTRNYNSVATFGKTGIVPVAKGKTVKVSANTLTIIP